MTDLTPEALAALDALAAAATPGPWDWTITTDRHWSYVQADDGSGDLYTVAGAISDDDNAAFLAAADPSTVRALIAALAEARAEVSAQTLVAAQYERERDAARGEVSALTSLVEGEGALIEHERSEHLAAAERAQREIERLRGIVVRDDGMVLACDFHLVLVASDDDGEAKERCPACAAQAAESRLGDATAQIKRMAEQRDEERTRANEAARLSAEARDALLDAERRWGNHQDVCVMASLDRETLETERGVAEARALRAEADAAGLTEELEAAEARAEVFNRKRVEREELQAAAEARLAAVRALHADDGTGHCRFCGDNCGNAPYPCATVRALDGT